MLLGGCVFVASVVPPEGLALLRPSHLLVATLAGVAAWYARRSWWPLFALGAISYVWLVVWAPLFVASYYAGTTLRRARDVALHLGLVALTFGASVGVGKAVGGRREIITATSVNTALLVMILVGLPFVLGLWTRARRDVLAAARERADRLEREQVMRAEQARSQERARIAREMHDVVAHRVSLMVLHAGALEMRAPDVPTARTATMIGDIGREALTNLRELLGVLRSPHQPADLAPQPTLADLDRLLDQSRALGISVRRHDHGMPRPLGTTVERTAYRVVQEALTNVHRHAGDARTDVHLGWDGEGVLHVEITDRGPAPAAEPPAVEPPAVEPLPVEPLPAGPLPGAGRSASGRDTLPGAGWGLAGLRERLELLGGTLQAGPRPDGGYTVKATIPTQVVGAS